MTGRAYQAGAGLPGEAQRSVSVLITQTSGAGTYTADIPLLAAAWIVDISVWPLVPWDGTSAVAELGDELDPDGFMTTLDLLTLTERRWLAHGDFLGAYTNEIYGAFAGAGMCYSVSARTLRLTVTQVGTGTAGRTLLMATYATTTPTAAVKA